MKSYDPPVIFGEWVKQRRKLLDLTQSELAHLSGCSVSALRKIESGERRPSKQLAQLLSESLELTPEEKQVFIRAGRGDVNLERLPAPFLASPHAPSPEIQPAPSSNNLPYQPTPLIGRSAELVALDKIFEDPQCRILTLTGVGGIGKTRLAIEFASNNRYAFEGGVFFIPLAPIISPRKIIPAIADALDFGFSGPSDPKEQLFRYITSNIKKDALFILDNLEHLLPSNPQPGNQSEILELILEILQTLPNVRILATSRERLNLYGEWTFELHGLSVPEPGFLGQIQEYESIELFVKSAQRVRANYVVTRDEEPFVIQVCQLVEGVPLAIELAAAWVGMLSSQEIAQEISANVDFLKTNMRDIPERHRSIRATFDHSWRLLTEEERKVLCQLSVFRGGFDRGAADHVAKASLHILSLLSSKSLIRRNDGGRFDLHEVIRQCALTYLVEDPCSFEIYDRHCEYYLAFLGKHEKLLKSGSQQEAIRWITDEIDNVRAGWEWANQHKRYAQLGKTVRAFGWYFEIAGLYRDGIEQLDLLVMGLKSSPEGSSHPEILGTALMQQALLYFRKGKFDRAQELYEESIAVLRPTGNQFLLADPLIFLGVLAHLNGDYERSKSLVEEGLACARGSKDPWFEAYAFCNLGYISNLLGNSMEGYEQMMTGLSLWREIGDPHAIALGLNFFVPTLNALGRYQEAITYMRESIALCEESKNRWGLGTAHRYLGTAYLGEGQFEEAQFNLRKSLEIFHEYTEGWDTACTLCYLGNVALLSGDYVEARRVYLEALRLAVDIKAFPIALDSLVGLAEVYIKTDHPGTGFRLLEYVVSNTITVQQSKDRATKMVEGVKSRLTEEEIVRAKEWSQGKPVQAILNYLDAGEPNSST